MNISGIVFEHKGKFAHSHQSTGQAILFFRQRRKSCSNLYDVSPLYVTTAFQRMPSTLSGDGRCPLGWSIVSSEMFEGFPSGCPVGLSNPHVWPQRYCPLCLQKRTPVPSISFAWVMSRSFAKVPSIQNRNARIHRKHALINCLILSSPPCKQ